MTGTPQMSVVSVKEAPTAIPSFRPSPALDGAEIGVIGNFSSVPVSSGDHSKPPEAMTTRAASTRRSPATVTCQPVTPSDSGARRSPVAGAEAEITTPASQAEAARAPASAPPMVRTLRCARSASSEGSGAAPCSWSRSSMVISGR